MTELPRAGDYGLLSDCHTAALVGPDGSIDWYCPPRFDAPTVFARALDGEEAGYFAIRPTEPYTTERAYLPGTLVLRTEFVTAGGRVALTDALALEWGAREHDVGLRSPNTLLRRVEGVEGQVEMEVRYVPRLEYGLTAPLLSSPDGAVLAQGGPVELHLFSDAHLEAEGTRAGTTFVVEGGQAVEFALAYRRTAFGEVPERPDVAAGLRNARDGWRSWTERHNGYDGLYRDEVRRSTLVLQGLTHAPGGGVIAAATTSLPAAPDGSQNWDYRYVWLRDLGLTLRALWVSSCPSEAARFFDWIDRAAGYCVAGDNLQVMYGLEGERDLTEHVLAHLPANGVAPVRVGNDAWSQRQIDVYGEVLDAAYFLRDRLGEPFPDSTSRLLATLANGAAEDWRRPDSGMWEARDRERHYLSSKVMCWVALDRAVRLADRLGDRAEVERWRTAREEVRETILNEGYHEGVGAFTGALGSDRLDASVLLMPIVGFIDADDPRMRRTIEKIERELAGDGLVHRWDGDANGFLLCTYWLVECLVRLGERDRAVELFERATACANDLGILAEQADPETGELLGNVPQAFSHVGLINAAWCLTESDPAKGERG